MLQEETRMPRNNPQNKAYDVVSKILVRCTRGAPRLEPSNDGVVSGYQDGALVLVLRYLRYANHFLISPKLGIRCGVTLQTTTMPSIPIDILQEILEHVRKADLPTLCRVNKICCSYSQDVLYRKVKHGDADVIQTLAQSTDLARRVRSFSTTRSSRELATALRNMSSLRPSLVCLGAYVHYTDDYEVRILCLFNRRVLNK
jgi:hypothetical protein